ncbi:MAG: hypothetical protein AB7H80_05860 [Candidatus Kapaibacterium sp.]
MQYERDFLKMVVLAAKNADRPLVTCDDCWEQVDQFAEMTLAGKDAGAALPLVKEHIEKCGECATEFNALLDALRATARLSLFKPDTGS